MEQLASVAFLFGVIGYSAAATLFFVDLARKDGAQRLVRLAPWLLGAGALSHLAHIVIASFLTRICPVESMHFGLSFTALIAAVVFLAIRARYKFNALGAVVAPGALTFLISAQFVGKQAVSSDIPRVLLALHVTSNLTGVALFILAGAASSFYLVEERRLKQRRISSLMNRLPPLSALDRTAHRLLLAGFPLLTFGVVSGGIFAGNLADASGAALLRAGLAYGTWLIVAGVLLLRAILGWSGRRAAYGTVAGVTSILLVILLYILRPSLGGSL
ncbi:MAG: cytochrome c biogenesis protein CcsA [Polyangiaceae bacterium]|nr:cytochrome c biogenesis protein CcsA [Polyangiaceae bacterium]